jgi:tetratricopeptide (TPR) repeat protein
MDQSPAYQRGLLLYRQRRFDAAIEEFQRELAVNPNNASALSMLGLALALSGDAVAGEAAALKAIECAPDQALPHYALATITIRLPLARFRKQRRWLGMLVTQSSETFAARERLGRARQSLLEATRINPRHPAYFNVLAAVELDLGNPGEALEIVERGLALSPEHVACRNLRSRILVRLGRAQEAADAVRESLAVDPEHPQTHATSGLAMLHLGEHEQSLRHYLEAMRLNPTNDASRRGLAEALRARNPIYRWLIRGTMRLVPRRRAPWMRLMIIFVCVVGLMLGQQENHRWENLGVTLLWVCVLGFIGIRVLIWPVMNLLLMLDPLGRRVLMWRERFNAAFLVLSFGWLIGAAASGAITGRGPLKFEQAFPVLLPLPALSAAIAYGRGKRCVRWADSSSMAAIGAAGFVVAARRDADGTKLIILLMLAPLFIAPIMLAARQIPASEFQ